MKTYILKRILALIPVLFVVSVIVFMIVHLTPGNPVAAMLGEDVTPQQVEELTEQLGLNLPLYQQYFNWVTDIFRGDFGVSYFMHEPVTDAIFSRLEPTLSLAILAQVVALIIAIPIGIISANRRGSTLDQSMMGVTLLGMSIPGFILGLFLMLLVGVYLKWLPVAGYQPLSSGLWNHLKYLILPAISLGAIQAALIARMTRSSMLEVLNTNVVKTLRSKGVGENKIVYNHALRIAFLPILTVIGQTFGSLITGAVITETIFTIPGIGQLIINSVERRDYAVIQGVLLFVTLAYVFINLVIDLLYGVIDPRVRLDKKTE